MTIQRHVSWAIPALCLTLQAPAAQAQGVNIGGLVGGFGSLIQSGIQADLQRQQLEQVERIERLRLEQLRRQQLLLQQKGPTPDDDTMSEAASPTPDALEPSPETPALSAQEQVRGYTVEGRHLGEVINLPASDPTFSCSGSEQFPGFQWCKRLRAEGKLNTQTAILKSPANVIAYYAKAFAPARFRSGSIDREITKLSSHYGTSARVMRAPASVDGSGAVIAIWGGLSFVAVAPSVTNDLAANRPVSAGVLVDYLGDARMSARQGLPVFRVSGGAGAFWAARFDRKGQGNLRFGIADASAFDRQQPSGASAQVAVTPPAAPVMAAADARTTAPSPLPQIDAVTPAPPPYAPTVQSSPNTAAQAMTPVPPPLPASQAAPSPPPVVIAAVQPAPVLPAPAAVAAPAQPASSTVPSVPAIVVQEAPGAPLPAHGTADRDQRIALVIGNSAYRAVAHLPNPNNDAEAVAGVLRSEGFAVKLVEDATLAEMKDALRTFQMRADNADWAVVYYAGHGIEISGQNYLIPVDAKLGSDQDADDEAVTLRYVLDKMHNARKLHLVILDACRDNPFQGTMKRQMAARGVARGLAPYEPTVPNEMVVYAARGGEQAQDDVDSGGHSPFAKALVTRMAAPGMELNKVFRLVTADVLADTHNRQQPFVYGSTPGAEDFYFKSN